MAFANSHLKGITITVIGVLILTPDGVFTTLIAADTRTALFWRGLFLGLALSLYVLLRYRSGAPAVFAQLRRPAVLGISVLFGASSIGWVVAIVSTSVANTIFITASAPLFAAIFARIFLKEHVPARTIFAILLSMAGMAIIFAEGLGRGDLLGNLAAMVTALAWAGMVVLLSHAKVEDPAPALAMGGYMVAAIAFIAAPTLAIVPLDFVWLGILGFLILPISFFLIGLGPRYLPAPEVSLIMLLEAVAGPLWAWLFITQTPSLQTMLGGALILVTLTIHFGIGLRRQYR